MNYGGIAFVVLTLCWPFVAYWHERHVEAKHKKEREKTSHATTSR